jgi:F-type H+-transporting ATPase subunit b
MYHRWWRLAVCLALVWGGVVPGAPDARAAADEHAAPADQLAHAENHAGDAAHAAGHDDHDKPALLQFDPGAAIWQIVVFVVLLLVLRAVAWKPILRVLNERESFIHDSLANAKREREAAESLLQEYRQQLERARGEAAEIIEQGRRDAEGVRERLLGEARAETADLTARARREIQLATDAAVKALYDRTAELSVQVASRIIGKALSAEDHRRLIEESISAIQREDGARLN